MPVAQGGLTFLWGGGVATAPATWYLLSGLALASQHAPLQAGGASPSDGTLNTSWIVDTVAPPAYARMAANNTLGSVVFTSTAQPSGAPSTIDSFRTGRYVGVIPAGTWTLNFSVIAEAFGGSQDGRIRVRIWRSPHVDGADAVEITSGVQLGTTVTNLTTTTPQTSTVTIALGSVTLNHEYVFFQVAWEITGASADAFSRVSLRQGAASYFSTPPFPSEFPTWGAIFTRSTEVEIDVSSRLMSYSSRRGREDALSGIGAGQLSATFDDDDGAFDPENTASPYYPDVKLRRKLQVIANYGGVNYYRNTIYAESYAAEPTALGANVTISGQDLYKQLLQRTVTGSFPAQSDADRIQDVLTLLGYFALSSSDGSFRPPAVTLTAEPALQHFDLLMKAGRGTFFIGRAGIPIYRDRHWRLEQVSIGSFGAQGTYPIPSPSPVLDDAGLFNRVILAVPSAITADDLGSQSEYGVISYTLDDDAGAMLASTADGVQWADWFLYQHKTPTSRFQSIELNPYADPALWPLILAADIGTRLTVMHDLPGTKGMVSEDYYIEGIAETGLFTGEPELRITWSVSRAETDSGHFWILDVADVLETDTILSY